jgi:hypothetical protein
MQRKIVGWMGKNMGGAAVACFKVLSRNLPQWIEEYHKKFVSSAAAKPGTSQMRSWNVDCYTTAFRCIVGKTVLPRSLTRGAIYLSHWKNECPDCADIQVKDFRWRLWLVQFFLDLVFSKSCNRTPQGFWEFFFKQNSYWDLWNIPSLHYFRMCIKFQIVSI